MVEGGRPIASVFDRIPEDRRAHASPQMWGGSKVEGPAHVGGGADECGGSGSDAALEHTGEGFYEVCLAVVRQDPRVARSVSQSVGDGALGLALGEPVQAFGGTVKCGQHLVVSEFAAGDQTAEGDRG